MFFVTRFLSFNHSHADLFHKVEQNQRQHLNDYKNAIKSLKKQTQRHIKVSSFPKEYVKNADFFKPILNKIIANANNEQNTILQQHIFHV